MSITRINRFESMVSELRADGADISLRAANVIEELGDELGEYLGAYNRVCGSVAKSAWPESELSDAKIVETIRGNSDIASMRRAVLWASDLIANGKIGTIPENGGAS